MFLELITRSAFNSRGGSILIPKSGPFQLIRCSFWRRFASREWKTIHYSITFSDRIITFKLQVRHLTSSNAANPQQFVRRARIRKSCLTRRKMEFLHESCFLYAPMQGSFVQTSKFKPRNVKSSNANSWNHKYDWKVGNRKG